VTAAFACRNEKSHEGDRTGGELGWLCANLTLCVIIDDKALDGFSVALCKFYKPMILNGLLALAALVALIID
jgi:hypothetical protein